MTGMGSISTSILGIRIPGISDLIDAFVTLYNYIISIPNIIITALQYAISFILYGLQQGFFYVINCVESLFRSIAGLGTYYIDNTEYSGDIVYALLTSETVMAVFWSVLVAAIFLLFVTTVIAVLKTEMDLSKSNAKGPVFGRALKSILYFALVPVVCIFGVYIANVFLQTFDSATSRNASSMANQIFSAASYDCNRARSSSSFAEKVKNSGLVPGITSTSTQADVANAIDAAFRSTLEPRSTTATTSANLSNGAVLSYDESTGEYTVTLTITNDSNFATITLDDLERDHMQGYAIFWHNYINFDTFSITNISLVYYYYDLLGYNYLIGYLGSFMVAMLLLTLIIGVIQRIFELSILFVVSPAFVATMPLDDGARYQKWRDAFVKRTLSAYGPVIGLNLLFMILTYVQQINIFQPGVGLNDLFNAIVQVLFIIVGLISVKDFSSLISELIGSNDALKDGESKKDATKELGGKIATAGAVTARMGAKTAAWAGRKGATAGRNKMTAQQLAKDWKGATGYDENQSAFSKQNREARKKAQEILKTGKVHTARGDIDVSERLAREGRSLKQGPGKLDLNKEFHKLDDTVTGGIRKRMKDADDKNANPLYALMGDTFDDTAYIKWHKDAEKAKKAKDKQKELEAEDTARKNIAEATIDKKVRAKLSPDAQFIIDHEGDIRAKINSDFRLEEARINADYAAGRITDAERNAQLVAADAERQRRVDELDNSVKIAQDIHVQITNLASQAKNAMDATDAARFEKTARDLQIQLEKIAKDYGKK